MVKWLIICFVLFFSGWAGNAARAQEGAVEVSYRDGRFQSSLPYARTFLLRGSTQIPGGISQADVIQVEIRRETEGSRRARWRHTRQVRGKSRPFASSFIQQPFFSATWWAGTVPGEQFSIYVDEPLELDTRYRFEFRYFRSYRIKDSQTQRIVEDLTEYIYRSAGGEIRVENIRRLLDQRLRQLQDSLGFGRLISDSQGGLRFDTSYRPLPFDFQALDTLSLQQAIGELARERQVRAEALQSLARERAELDLTRRTSAYARLITRLGELAAGGTLRQADVQALERFAATGRSAGLDFSPLISRQVAEALGEPGLANVLRQLEAVFEEIQSQEKSLAAAEEKIVDLQAALRSTGLSQQVESGFILANTALLITGARSVQAAEVGENQRSGISEITLVGTGDNTINLGTAFGYGVAGLNFGMPAPGQQGLSLDMTEANFISYAAVKFYLSKIDKSRLSPNPYPLFYDRFSILAGIKVSGRLNYRGQDMDNVLGITPFVGLGLDLNRAVGLDLGWVLFEQPSVSPLLDTKRLRAAPVLGLSVDFNTFNVAKRLLSPYAGAQ
jgi:hypothetical protein